MQARTGSINSVGAAFLGAYTIGLQYLGDKDLTIAHIAGGRGFQNAVYGTFQELVGYHNGQITPLYVRRAIGNTPIHMSNFFVSYPGYVPITEKIDLYIVQGLLDLIELGFSNDRFDLLHNIAYIGLTAQKYIKKTITL